MAVKFYKPKRGFKLGRTGVYFDVRKPIAEDTFTEAELKYVLENDLVEEYKDAKPEVAKASEAEAKQPAKRVRKK